MDEKDELERIMEDLSFDTPEDVDQASEGSERAVGSNSNGDDNPETRSERLERLYREGELSDKEFELRLYQEDELTDEKFELLQTALIESRGSS